MKLFGDCSGKKLRTGEKRIGSGLLGLPSDPILHEGQSFSRLVDVVALGDVRKRVEQGVETLVARECARESQPTRAYSGHTKSRARSNDLCHATAFPLGAAGYMAEARTPAPPQP